MAFHVPDMPSAPPEVTAWSSQGPRQKKYVASIRCALPKAPAASAACGRELPQKRPAVSARAKPRYLLRTFVSPLDVARRARHEPSHRSVELTTSMTMAAMIGIGKCFGSALAGRPKQDYVHDHEPGHDQHQ